MLNVSNKLIERYENFQSDSTNDEKAESFNAVQDANRNNDFSILHSLF